MRSRVHDGDLGVLPDLFCSDITLIRSSVCLLLLAYSFYEFFLTLFSRDIKDLQSQPLVKIHRHCNSLDDRFAEVSRKVTGHGRRAQCCESQHQRDGRCDGTYF
jgi:hypothetical protein